MTQETPPFSAKRQVLYGFVTIAVLLGGFGFWSVTANISGAIVAPGAIEVDHNQQVVQHPDGGVIAAILVKNGDLVQAGDILITLDSSNFESQRAIKEGSLYEVLARYARLTAERDGRTSIEFDPELLLLMESRADVRDVTDGQVRLFNSRIDTLASQTAQLEKRVGQIESQIEGIKAQEIALTSQLTLLRPELINQQTLLAKGLTQAARVLALQREEATILGQQGSLIAQRAEFEGRITEIRIEILSLTSQRRENAITELRDLGFKLLELREQLRAVNQVISSLDIRAPVSGVIHAMSVFVERAVVKPADPLLYIVPQDRPLLIASRIEPIHIDEVFIGQEVVVRFAAFDAKTTPELLGHVVTISADVFTDQTNGVSFYRAGINLSDGEIEKLPEGLTLVPGMPADAFIRTSDRTPLAYLLKPVKDYFNKAFRE